jgi:hypothetical protein
MQMLVTENNHLKERLQSAENKLAQIRKIA